MARTRSFVLLATVLSLAALATYAAIINLVPLLEERGIATQLAAVALGLDGAGQVVGRLGYAVIVRRTSVLTRTAAILLALAVTTALLGVLTTAFLLVSGAIVAGMARGVFTLVQAAAITDRWGRRPGVSPAISGGTVLDVVALGERPQKWINQSNCAGPALPSGQELTAGGGGGGVKAPPDHHRDQVAC